MRTHVTSSSRPVVRRPIASWVALVVLTLHPPTVAGQVEAQTRGSIDFRYASQTAHALYGTHDVGFAAIWVGMVQGTHTAYEELVGGIAGSWGIGRARATVTLAGAHTSDGWYGQLYVVPTFTVGRLGVSGILEAYVPIDGRGARQLHISPMNALVSVVKWVRVGASYTLATHEGTTSAHRVGPAIEVSFGDVTTTLTTLAGINRTSGECRLYLGARW